MSATSFPSLLPPPRHEYPLPAFAPGQRRRPAVPARSLRHQAYGTVEPANTSLDCVPPRLGALQRSPARSLLNRNIARAVLTATNSCITPAPPCAAALKHPSTHPPRHDFKAPHTAPVPVPSLGLARARTRPAPPIAPTCRLDACLAYSRPAVDRTTESQTQTPRSSLRHSPIRAWLAPPSALLPPSPPPAPRLRACPASVRPSGNIQILVSRPRPSRCPSPPSAPRSHRLRPHISLKMLSSLYAYSAHAQRLFVTHAGRQRRIHRGIRASSSRARSLTDSMRVSHVAGA
ncbi:hypothetical protein HYPSUDRAFT_203762 [Hypholoma sublateritium FD-334 SS-4]|uniref:Uncharacterized protein n=1 Tax=Hypholoma sublateritium (strain FD-334 SS-4) TaxID=945553 RepID=A0A0D2PKE0_HYPSF|nr:hypothetical protein HYPSUDRAFT_203762 [Hypholoma sublateritium FD-334 SS-4]